MADPETAEMYIERPVQEGQMPKYVCIRGTSQLEGYFAHLRSMFAGSNYSPLLAMTLMTIFNYRQVVSVCMHVNSNALI